MLGLGWNSSESVIMFTYNEKAKELRQRPMAAPSVAGRLTTLLHRYAEMSQDELKAYGSHSMRRGGTTYYSTHGLST
jgi:hypothetical protein